jgi:hypothetical protein
MGTDRLFVLLKRIISKKKSPRGRFFFEYKRGYFPNNSMIFALSSSPLKSCATTFPD